MAARLATEGGITGPAGHRRRHHRLPAARPHRRDPHGDIKYNMGLDHLSLDGKRKAAAEWTFACAVRNLRTAISSGHLTHHALDNLDASGWAAALAHDPAKAGQAA